MITVRLDETELMEIVAALDAMAEVHVSNGQHHAAELSRQIARKLYELWYKVP